MYKIYFQLNKKQGNLTDKMIQWMAMFKNESHNEMIKRTKTMKCKNDF